MARFALGSGLRVPALALEVLHSLGCKPVSAPGRQPEVGGLEHPKAAEGLSLSDMTRLARAHQLLSQVIAPALPRTLALLDRNRSSSGRWSLLGPVRIVRHMMAIGFASLVAFVLTTLSPQVTGQVDFARTSGINLLLNEMLLFSAAGIGAAFSALFKANGYIGDGTYDPRFDSSYWARFVLGLLAGMVLAILVPIQGPSQEFGKPILALLGGFSASVVYRILARLVETLESLVQGENREMLANQREAAKLRASQEVTHARTQLANNMLAIKDRLQSGASREELMNLLKVGLVKVLPDGEDEPVNQGSQ